MLASHTTVPLVLTVSGGDRSRRFELAEGEFLIGSSRECDLQLGHPTVSRRHARLTISAQGVELEDLESSNGTRLDGERVTGTQKIEPGATLTFGNQVAHLLQVEDADLETAVELPARGPGAPEAEEMESPELPSTASIGSMRAFALRKLPGVLDQLEERAGIVRTAQAVGAALFETLPCTFVEISVPAAGGERGIIFESRHDEVETSGAEERCDVGSVEVVAGFPHAAQAQGFGSLVESAARLIGLAERKPTGARLPANDQTPPLPEPPTVVPAVRKTYHDAARVAQGTIGVLIGGASGTGKEVLARFIHAASPRRDEAFVALNCAALPRDLLEAELFGVEKGVATGVTSRPGKFEQADGGTLFLDEIGDMAPETQAKILRVLQEGEVYRLGSAEPRSAEVRVIAATNRSIDVLLEDGAFRADLYHRIADWRIELPPLRERQADIPNLAAYFLAREAESRGISAAGISRAAIEALLAFDWPGNIRQLEREMARAALFLENGELLQSSHLQEAIRISTLPAPEQGTLRDRLDTYEGGEIQQALAAHDGNMAATASALGLGRSTLYRRIKELGIRAEE